MCCSWYWCIASAATPKFLCLDRFLWFRAARSTSARVRVLGLVVIKPVLPGVFSSLERNSAHLVLEESVNFI